MIRGIRYLHTDDLPDVTRFCWSDYTQSYRPFSPSSKKWRILWGPAPFPITLEVDWRILWGWGYPHDPTDLDHGPSIESSCRSWGETTAATACGHCEARCIGSAAGVFCGCNQQTSGRFCSVFWWYSNSYNQLHMICFFFSEKCGVEPLQWRF